MFTRILFSLAAIGLTCVSAQTNLVPNPGFDTVISCPTFPGQWDKCKGWNNVNLITGTGMHGTPDFYHSCGTGSTSPPATFAGTCSPHTGDGMMGLVLYNSAYANAREYVSAKLNCPMEPGKTYTVSFWTTNGTGHKSPFVIKNVGVYFSQSPPSQSGFALMNVTPQCEVTGYVQSTSWVQYTFAITPTSTFSYMTIGSFRNDQMNSPMSVYSVSAGPNAAYAHYYFDDIAVLAGSCACEQPSFSLVASSDSVCAGQSVQLTAGGADSYTWSTGTTGSVSLVTPVGSTVYSISAKKGTCEMTGSIAIHVYDDNLAISGPTLVCIGQAVSLSASGASSYTWSTGHTGSVLTVTPTAPVTDYTVNAVTAEGCHTSLSFSVQISDCTSLENHRLLPLVVYPNPGKTEFRCNADEAAEEIYVTDVTGRAVRAEVGMEDGKLVIRIPGSAAGVYFIRARNSGFVQRIVVSAE